VKSEIVLPARLSHVSTVFQLTVFYYWYPASMMKDFMSNAPRIIPLGTTVSGAGNITKSFNNVVFI